MCRTVSMPSIISVFCMNLFRDFSWESYRVDAYFSDFVQHIMSRKIDRVKDIDDSKETWCLAVRIIDVWTVINNKGI